MSAVSSRAVPPGVAAAGGTARPADLVDPRGLRVVAALTSVVLALVLVTGNGWLLLAQAVVFALGTRDRSPYAVVYRRLVRPRLGPPRELEDARPPRFAQGVGLVFAAVGVTAFAVGSATVALVATAFALTAALLLAVFGLCLGCELYLLLIRFSRREATASREEV